MEAQSRDEIILARVMDFQNTFASDAGKRVLLYLSRFCLEHRTTFVEDSERKSSFNEGARSVIQEIRRWLEMDLMSKEIKL